MKRVKRVLVLFVCILLLNGCVKNNTTMTINKDKNVNLEILLIVKNEYKNTFSQMFNTRDLERKDFKVTTTTDGDYSGYKITKSFESIDSLSYGTNNTVTISNIIENDFDYSTMFTKKTTFFKDTYTANFIYTIDKYQELYNPKEEEYENTETENEQEEVNLDNDVSVKYTIVLPSKAESNDAKEVKDGGKTLIWNISNNGETKINFTFSYLNYNHIFMIALGAVALIIILITIIIIVKKKKHFEGTLIYKDEVEEEQTNLYPESAKNDPNRPEISNTDNVGPEVVDNLEFVLPDEETKNHVEVQTPINHFNIENAKAESVVDEKQQFINTESSAQVQTEVPNVNVQVVQEPSVQVNTFDYNRRPDFVRQTEPSKFVSQVSEEQTPKEEISTTYTSPTQNLDIPNATALSDMDNN